ncbi:hypothetical protein BH11ARM2_BH11ARM2_08480 [soil metagenome]
MPKLAALLWLCFPSLLLLAGCGGSAGTSDEVRTKDPLETGNLFFHELTDAQRAGVAGYPTKVAATEIPASFDGRTYAGWTDANGHSCLTAPWTQGDTTFCWAFSASTAASDRARIAARSNPQGPLFQTTSYPCFDKDDNAWDGPPITVTNGFAPIGVGECGISGATGGCRQSGHPMLAYDYLFTSGAPLLAQWGQYSCSGSCPSFSGLTIFKSGQPYYVTPTNLTNPSDPPAWTPQFSSMIQQDLYANGPVSVGFHVAPNFKDWWASGASATDVFGPEDTAGDDYNEPSEYAGLSGHAVVIVGWGTSPTGQDYWIIRNSWGQVNGDGGYFKMARGLNFCSIEQNAVACDPAHGVTGDISPSYTKV